MRRVTDLGCAQGEAAHESPGFAEGQQSYLFPKKADINQILSLLPFITRFAGQIQH